MLKRLRSRLHGEGGFTLIELLVVILIIGILAAIAIPSFLNQQGKGKDSATKSTVRNAQTAMETYFTDNGDYLSASPTALHSIEVSIPTSNLTINASGGSGSPSSANGYRVTYIANGRTFWVDKDSSGNVTRGCTPTGQGGCPASGQW